jgi:hypothetical protein
MHDGWLLASTYVPDGADRLVVGLQLQGADTTAGVEATYSISLASFEEGELCDSCRAFLDQCFERLRGRFLFAERVDWPLLRHVAMVNATGADSLKDIYPVMRDVMRR